MIVPLERYYPRSTTMIRRYPLRGKWSIFVLASLGLLITYLIDRLSMETPPNQRSAGGPVRRERRRLSECAISFSF